MINDGGIWRKILISGEWFEWVFFEIEVGFKSKVVQVEKNVKNYIDNYIDNSSIYIINDECVKWNGV